MLTRETILGKPITAVMTVLKWIGSLVLASMMFLTAADVACRYVFNDPIAGALELVEYMMAILIPFSVAYCAYTQSHVAVEFIMDKFPAKFKKAVMLPINVLTIIFAGLITWQTCLYVAETYASKLTSSVLLIVTYPFIIPVALGMGMFTLILVYELMGGFTERKVE